MPSGPPPDPDDFGDDIIDEKPSSSVDAGGGEISDESNSSDSLSADLARDDDSDLDAEAAPELISIKDYLSSKGYPVDAADDEAALNAMIQRIGAYEQERQRLYQESQQQQAYVAQLQQQQWAAWQQQQAMAAWQQQQRQAQQQTPPAYRGRMKLWQEIPQWDPQWEQFLTHDAEGNLVVKSGGDQTLPQKYMARRNWERQALQSFIENPQEFFADVFTQTPAVQQLIDQRVQQIAGHLTQQSMGYWNQQRMIEQQHQAEAMQITREIERWGIGQDGQPSQAMIAYVQAVQHVASDPRYANQSPGVQHQVACQLLQQMTSAFQPAQSTTTATETQRENGATKRMGILKAQATNATSRGGSLARTERRTPPQNQNSGRMDLERELHTALRAAGLSA